MTNKEIEARLEEIYSSEEFEDRVAEIQQRLGADRGTPLFSTERLNVLNNLKTVERIYEEIKDIRNMDREEFDEIVSSEDFSKYAGNILSTEFSPRYAFEFVCPGGHSKEARDLRRKAAAALPSRDVIESIAEYSRNVTGSTARLNAALYALSDGATAIRDYGAYYRGREGIIAQYRNEINAVVEAHKADPEFMSRIDALKQFRHVEFDNFISNIRKGVWMDPSLMYLNNGCSNSGGAKLFATVIYTASRTDNLNSPRFEAVARHLWENELFLSENHEVSEIMSASGTDFDSLMDAVERRLMDPATRNSPESIVTKEKSKSAQTLLETVEATRGSVLDKKAARTEQAKPNAPSAKKH